MKAIKLECYKLRRKRLWLIALAMGLTVALWMTVGLRDLDADGRAEGFSDILYQAPLLNSIVLPVFIAVLVSRSCDMEHKGGALKSLFTMQTPESLFMAKLALDGAYLLAAILLQAASFLLIGRVCGFTEALAPRELLLYVFSQWLVSMFLALLIQILALRYVNQFIPMTVGLIGGFLGLMAMFFPPVVMRLAPSAYYGLLSTVRMDWDSVTRTVDYYRVPFSLGDCALLCVAGLVLFIVGLRRFAKREV